MSAPVGAQHQEVAYQVPNVTLVRHDGTKVALATELDDGRPVIMNFIFTSCTTICPLLSHVFSQVQAKLGPARDQVHMISISIDPEYDTPARLSEHAKQVTAGPQWHFYTGSIEASVEVQRAFDVYRGDKMNHTPVTLVRTAPGKNWTRLEGFASADAIIDVYRSGLTQPVDTPLELRH